MLFMSYDLLNISFIIFGFIVLLLSYFIYVAQSDLLVILHLSLISVMSCVIYSLLDAADVAMTEASVGVCLSTIVMLFFYRLNRSKEEDLSTATTQLPSKIECSKRFGWHVGLAAFVTLSMFVLMLRIVLALPSFGDINTPLNISEASKYYVTNMFDDIGINSYVAAILASYRGFDTLCETIVILLAGLSVTSILSFFDFILDDNSQPRTIWLGSAELKKRIFSKKQIDSNEFIVANYLLSTTVVTKFLLPLMLIYVAYIQIYGEAGPGGGFQAGALLASMFIAYDLLYCESYLFVISLSALELLSAIGVIFYFGAGLAAMMMNSSFLDYAAFNIPHAEHIGIAIVEFGVLCTVFSVMLSIYYNFKKYSYII